MLESAGLQINLSKSAAIIRVKGPRLRAFQKNYIMQRRCGVLLKCITREGKVYQVPIGKKWDYFGTTLSYSPTTRKQYYDE